MIAVLFVGALTGVVYGVVLAYDAYEARLRARRHKAWSDSFDQEKQ
jgi:hypothetical protein